MYHLFTVNFYPQSMAAATPSLQGYIFHLPEALLISELIL